MSKVIKKNWDSYTEIVRLKVNISKVYYFILAGIALVLFLGGHLIIIHDPEIQLNFLRQK